MKHAIRCLDPLQSTYRYTIDDSRTYREDFTPDFAPAVCLKMGVFGGSYFAGYTRFHKEFPHLTHTIWPETSADNNYFGVLASMSRREWVIRGWMYEHDPRGWFQWYCRYDMGRRSVDDDRQIERWKAFKKRKLREVEGNTDLSHKAATRQGLLHWAIASPGMRTT